MNRKWTHDRFQLHTQTIHLGRNPTFAWIHSGGG
jgi:hypothetical protein